MSVIDRFLARATWTAERLINAVTSGASKVAKARRPPASPTTRITQFAPDNQAHWPVEDILFALQQHEDGYFHESAKLAKAFGRDDRISSCRNTRARALVGRNGATFDVVPSTDGDQRRSASICERVKSLWFRCFTEDVVTHILADVIDLGVSISRIHWHWIEATSQWEPRLEPWDMRWVYFDRSKGNYVTQTAAGLVDIIPNTGEWLIVEPAGAQGWMAGAVRALAMTFFFRAMTWKDWARYCEKHGIPILAIDEPPNEANAAKGAKSTKETFFASLKRLGREGILRLPRSVDGKSGYAAKMIEPTTLSWPAFEAFLKRLDVCIAIFLLGQNLSTEVQGGSLAATTAQNRVRLDYLAADAQGLSTSFREQVLTHWGRFNIEGWSDELAPWPKWDTDEPTDLQAKSLTLVNVSGAIETLKRATTPVDERELLELYSIPILSEADFAKQQEEGAKAAADALKQQQQAAPVTPTPGGDPAKDTTPKKDDKTNAA